jgi:hypothetical protein
MTDDDVARAVADDPDAPPLDLDWTQARLSLPPGKEAVTLRLDRDVLSWLRAQGKGYQTRINQVLRVWYNAARHKKAVAIQKAAAKRKAKKAAAPKEEELRDWVPPAYFTQREINAERELRRRLIEACEAHEEKLVAQVLALGRRRLKW